MPNLASVDTSTTPIEFGPPVRPFFITANGHETDYLDSKQSWIFVEEHTVRLPFKPNWKTFSPHVRFHIKDIQRLQEYHTEIQLSLSNNNNVLVNRERIPNLHYTIDTDSWGLSGCSDWHTEGYCGSFMSWSMMRMRMRMRMRKMRMSREEEDVEVKRKKDEEVVNSMMGVHEENEN
ncbi:hypothetical protein EV426DRAFT_704417 [Tirmania nivea]|nr:hypothetical protein EV426DRAFT_704417 [Tirmania nivea]